MLTTLLTVAFLTLLQSCKAGPTFQEEYRGSYVPKVIETWYGLQVVAPDTPYVAASGPDKLYFIDTRFDDVTASHVKEQIERATLPKTGEYLFIDEISATVEIRNSETNETTFIFDPPYARVMFAKGINKRNPELNLPEHEPAGDWEVTYDIGTTLTKRAVYCSSYGCYYDQDCINQSGGRCTFCQHYRVDNECSVSGITNAIGICHPKICVKAVDTPKENGETDTDYYQRMDKLHWE